MAMYPRGLKEEEVGLVDPSVAVHVQMLPPRDLAGSPWICEDVEAEVVLHNWYEYGVHCWDVMTFKSGDDTCRFGSILPCDTLQADSGWLNTERKALVIGRLKLPIPPDVFGESIRSLDLTQEVTQVTFQLCQGPRHLDRSSVLCGISICQKLRDFFLRLNQEQTNPPQPLIMVSPL